MKIMKIPKTTLENPYIQFQFNKSGKLTLKIDNGWWGGINAGFISSNDTSGNTCLPKDLEKYIKKFKTNKVKELDKQIFKLLKTKSYYEN